MATPGNHQGSLDRASRWPRVKEIFLAALEQGSSQRAAFLDSACGDDTELRRDVESLLTSHEGAADFIETPPEALKPLLETESQSLPFAPGTRVGSYQLVRELGQGGMGSVFLAARADEEFQKRVAIKLIRPGLVSDFIVRRFRGERQILARLEHANIARLIDGGTLQGMPYFVMEYVEGLPITEYAKTRATSRTKNIEVFLQACSAVQYAHDRQIIHRDLKPNNVLVKNDGTPKLLDFGIAKMLNAEPGQALETTLMGVRMLTPAYASPEQLRGDASTVASDIYSLGVLLHEVLTGSRPERPGAASPDLPASLRHIVARAIQEQPENRYISVEALAADLRVWLAAQSLAAEPTGIAVLPFWVMQPSGDTDSMMGLALADAVITQLTNNARIRVRSTASVKKWTTETDPLAAGAELGVDYVLEGHIRTSTERVRVTVQLVGIREKAPVWAAQFEETAGDLLHLEDTLARQIAEAASQQLSGAGVQRSFQKRTVKPAAYQAYLKGRWHFARYNREALGKALVAFSQAVAEDPLYGPGHAGIADYHIWQAIWGGVPSGESAAAAKSAAQKAVELDPAAADAHAALGWSCWAVDRDFTAAERELKHAIQLESSLGRAHQWLGILYAMQGRREESAAALERARETDPDCPWFAAFQALAFYYAREYARAVEVLEPFAPGKEPIVEEVRARCLLETGDLDRAKEAATRAVDFSGRTPGALAVLAMVLYEAGDLVRARRIREELTAAARSEYVSTYLLALVAVAAGDRKQALDLLAKGVRGGDWWSLWARVEPRFDTLRHLKAFQTALRPLSARNQAPSRMLSSSAWIGAAALIAVAALVVAFTLLRSKPTPFEQIHIRKLTVNGTAAHAAISRDGKYVAYAVHEGIMQSLWLRQVHSPATVRITPPLDAELMRISFSGDGTALNFVAAQRNDTAKSALLQVPILGGPIRRVREHLAGPAAISEDGQHLARIEANSAKSRDELHVSMLDGSADRILWVRNHPDHFAWPSTPSWSRDGKRILCAIEGSDAGGYYNYPVAIDVDGRGRKVFNERRWQYIDQATWTGDGRGAMVIGREKDSSFLHIWYLPYGWGQALQITNDLADYSGLTVTADSKSLVSVQYQTLSNIYILKPGREDQPLQVTPGSGRYFDLRWTRQDKLLYSSDGSGAAEIWMMDPDGSGQHPLTSGPGRSYAPAASPEGDTVVFHSNRTGSWNIWRMGLDGNSLAQLTFGPQDSNWPQVTPDGKWVVYHRTGAEAMWNIFRVPLAGGQPEQLSRKLTTLPAVSPVDGKVACWYSEDAARPSIKLAIFAPGGGEPLQTIDVAKTVATDSALRWTPDGKAVGFIDYGDGGGNVWVQPLDGAPARPLTRFKSGMIFSFDWAKDGRLAISQGVSTADVVLITDARP